MEMLARKETIFGSCSNSGRLFSHEWGVKSLVAPKESRRDAWPTLNEGASHPDGNPCGPGRKSADALGPFSVTDIYLA